MMKRKLKTNGAPNQVAKGPLPIGVTVDGAEKGVNGVVVSGLSRNGALAKDGRVKVSFKNHLRSSERYRAEDMRSVCQSQS